MDQNQKIFGKEQEAKQGSDSGKNIPLKNGKLISQIVESSQGSVEQKKPSLTGDDGEALIKKTILISQEVKKKIDEDILNKYITAFQKKPKVKGVDILKIENLDIQQDRHLSGQEQSQPSKEQKSIFTNQEVKIIKDGVNQIVNGKKREQNQISDLLIKNHQSMKKKRDQQIQALQKLLDEECLLQENSANDLSHNHEINENSSIHSENQQDEDEHIIGISSPIKKPQLYSYSAPVLDIQIFKSFYPRYEQKLPRKNDNKLFEQLIYNEESNNISENEVKQKQEDLANAITRIQILKTIDEANENHVLGHQMEEFKSNNHQLEQYQEQHFEITEREKEINQFMKTQKQLEEIIVDIQQEKIGQNYFFQEQSAGQIVEAKNEQSEVKQFIAENQLSKDERIQQSQAKQSIIENEQPKDEGIQKSEVIQYIVQNQQSKNKEIYLLQEQLTIENQKEKQIEKIEPSQAIQFIIENQKPKDDETYPVQEQLAVNNLFIKKETIEHPQAKQPIINNYEPKNEEIQHLQEYSTANNLQIKNESEQLQAKQSIVENQQSKNNEIYRLSINFKETSQLNLLPHQIQDQKQNDSIFSQISPISLAKARSLKALQLSKLIPLSQSLPPKLATSIFTHSSNLHSQISSNQQMYLSGYHDIEAHNTIDLAKCAPIKRLQLFSYNPFVSEAIQIFPFCYFLNKQKIPKKNEILQIQVLNKNEQSQLSEQPKNIQLLINMKTTSRCIPPILKNIQINQQNLIQTPIPRKKLQKLQFLTTSSKLLNPSKLHQNYNIQPDYDTNIEQTLKQIPLYFTNSHTNQPLMKNLKAQIENGKPSLNDLIKHQTYSHMTHNTPRSARSNTGNYFGSANTGKSELNSDLHPTNNLYNLPSSRWTYQQVSPIPKIVFNSQSQQITILNHQQPIRRAKKIDERQYIIQKQKAIDRDNERNGYELKMQKQWSNQEFSKIRPPIQLRPSSKKKRQSCQSEKYFVADRNQNVEKPSARLKTQVFIERSTSPLRKQKIKVTQNTKSPFERKICQTEPNLLSPEKEIRPYNASSDNREHQFQQKKQKQKISLTLKGNINNCPPVISYEESQIQMQYKPNESPIRNRLN